MGAPGRIQVSEAMNSSIGDHFVTERKDNIEVRGKGRVTTYLVVDPFRVGIS